MEVCHNVKGYFWTLHQRRPEDAQAIQGFWEMLDGEPEVKM